jgi:hypothetical protein
LHLTAAPSKSVKNPDSLWAWFYYDQSGNSLMPSITNGKGRRTGAWTLDSTATVQSESVGYSWSYDAAGRVVQQVARTDNTNYPVTYDYTASGCGCPAKDLQSLTYPGNFKVNYTRDSIGRVLGISNPNPLSDEDWYVRDVEYNSRHGAPSLVRFGNQIADTFSYDELGRIFSIYIRDVPYPSMTWTFSYNGSGAISQITESMRESLSAPPVSRFNYS